MYMFCNMSNSLEITRTDLAEYGAEYYNLGGSFDMYVKRDTVRFQ